MKIEHSPLMIDVATERETRLETLHPVFRELDAAVHAYVNLVRECPNLSDEQLEARLLAAGIEQSVATGCATFVPLAFGRVVVTELVVNVADTFVEYDLATKRQTEKPLAEQFEYIWAKNVVDIYQRSPDYNDAFKAIAIRSAELSAVNNALNGGCDPDSLRESKIAPPTIFVGEPPKRWWQFWK